MHLGKRFVALLAIACGTGAFAFQQSTPPPAIRDVQPVTFPAYNTYPRMELYASPEEYARAIGDRAFVMERVTYPSDGLDVYAYLYRPVSPPRNPILPVIVYNRGSYVRDDFSPEVLMLANRFARQGFVVVAPMLRGSGGAPGRDEIGGADLHDVFNIVPVISQIPYADPTRLFLYGESRGGTMSLLAARDGFPARAIAVWGAITDLGNYLAEDSAMRRLAPTIWPDFADNETSILESRSAVRWPEKINVPVLLMNGGADTRVSPLHAIQFAAALSRLGKQYELKIFHGENHIATRRAPERDEDAVRWFRRFDAPPPRP